MSKFSIFTLFLSATIVIIVAELLVNEYLRYPALPGQLMANVVAENASGNDVESVKDHVVAPESDQADAATEPGQAVGQITFALMAEAGFRGMTLQRVPFNGILFESIDLRDFKSVPIVQHHVLENNRIKAATFYEFGADSHFLAREVYLFLREKSGQQIGAANNETNEFGDGSFYINYLERPEKAFMVVKIGNDVYALTYRKEYHPLIKQLITLLSYQDGQEITDPN